jgi:hypothetical protein
MKGMKGDLMDTEFVISPLLHGQISQEETMIRRGKFGAIMELARQGMQKKAIARALGVSVKMLRENTCARGGGGDMCAGQRSRGCW